MKLGINTYTYMWSIGFENAGRAARPARPMGGLELLAQAHALGVKVVQVGPNLPLAALTEDELDRFVRQAAEWGIELELGTRGLEFGHLQAQIRLARRIGATLLRTVPEVGGQTPPTGSVPDYLRAVLPVLQEHGVCLGLENGKIPAEEMRWILDEVDSPALGVVLDTANSLAVPEGWREVTRCLAPYTICLHLKDFVVKRVWSMMGFVVEGAPAGEGQVDIPWLLDALRVAQHDFNVIVELWPPEQATLEETIALEQDWAVRSVHNMRAYVKD
jgi:3-oxoisoapionate decarboxylase